jgi:hypothetical protein
LPFLRLSSISSGVRRCKHECVMVAIDDVEVLAAGAGVEGLAPIGAEAVAPAFVWRERGGK